MATISKIDTVVEGVVIKDITIELMVVPRIDAVATKVEQDRTGRRVRSV